MANPKKKIRAGSVSATIWENERKGEMGTFTAYSVTIEKNYKDGDNWKQTSSFNVDELPKVALVAEEAYKDILIRDGENGGSKEGGA